MGIIKSVITYVLFRLYAFGPVNDFSDFLKSKNQTLKTKGDVREIMASNPVGDSYFFCDTGSCHVEYPIFHIIFTTA